MKYRTIKYPDGQISVVVENDLTKSGRSMFLATRARWFT